ALGDVLHRANHLQHLAGLGLADNVRVLVDDPLRTICADDPVNEIVRLPLLDRFYQGLPDAGAVLRVNAAEETLAGDFDRSRLITKNTENLVRPAQRVSADIIEVNEVHLPASQVGHPLRGSQIGLAFPQPLRRLSSLGDIANVTLDHRLLVFLVEIGYDFDFAA